MRRRQKEQVGLVVPEELDAVPVAHFARGTQELEPIREDTLIEDEIAQIVHDLKSPLSAIVLESALLDEKLLRGDNSGSHRSLARINHNVAFLDRLVLDLLDVCSMSTGHLRLQREIVDLRDLIDNVIDRLVAPADRPRIFIDAALPVFANVDTFRIERVVANLLDNAIKYSPKESAVVVRLAAYRGGACLSVIDGGPGLSPDEVAYVFDRYRRAASTRAPNGHGIGLYVSKKIVEAHGGQIGVESIRGAGSRFFFELPAS